MPASHTYVDIKKEEEEDIPPPGFVKIEQVSTSVKREGASVSASARHVPDDIEYGQAIINIANGVSIEMNGYPEFRDRLLSILVCEFGLAAETLGEDAMNGL